MKKRLKCKMGTANAPCRIIVHVNVLLGLDKHYHSRTKLLLLGHKKDCATALVHKNGSKINILSIKVQSYFFATRIGYELVKLRRAHNHFMPLNKYTNIWAIR